jgi:hypothetical protein
MHTVGMLILVLDCFCADRFEISFVLPFSLKQRWVSFAGNVMESPMLNVWERHNARKVMEIGAM